MSNWGKKEAYEFVKSKGFLRRSSVTSLDERMSVVYELRGVSMNEGRTLRYMLISENSVTPSELADELYIPRPTMTKILDSLESRGWIERGWGVKDRRTVALKLTETGRKFAAEVAEFCFDFHSDVLQNFSKEEIETYYRVKGELMKETDRQLELRRGEKKDKTASK